jgi:hypothetical protein
VVRVPVYRSRGPGSIPGATGFSEKETGRREQGARNRTQTSGSVASNSDHYTTEVVTRFKFVSITVFVVQSKEVLLEAKTQKVGLPFVCSQTFVSVTFILPKLCVFLIMPYAYSELLFLQI